MLRFVIICYFLCVDKFIGAIKSGMVERYKQNKIFKFVAIKTIIVNTLLIDEILKAELKNSIKY